MKILIIEDDPDTRALVQFALSEDGYVVEDAGTVTDGAVLALTGEYDAILMDVVLPDGNGIELARRLRREGRSTPILMLTGQRDKEDVVRGLDAGADDYLAKPFAFDELKARLRALLRRGGASRTDQLSCGNIVLNRVSRQALVAGARLSLTPKEFALLEFLLLHVGQVVTRTQILERVWERQRDPDSNVIDALVARLRSKLRDAHATADLATVRGFGFSLGLAPAGADTPHDVATR